MADDFIASLKPWPIEDIQLGDKVYRIPALPAADWLALLMGDQVSLTSIIPALLQPDATEHFTDLVVDGALDQNEWENLVWEIVSIAGGRPWWTIIRLIDNARSPTHSMRVRSQLAFAGVDANRISLSAWLDAVYAIFVPPNTRPEDKQVIDMILTKPPADLKNETQKKEARAANKANFMALMASQ